MELDERDKGHHATSRVLMYLYYPNQVPRSA